MFPGRRIQICLTASWIPSLTSRQAASRSGQPVTGLSSLGRPWSLPNGALSNCSREGCTGITSASPVSARSEGGYISLEYNNPTR